MGVQEAGEFGPVVAGALHADGQDLAVRSQPPQEVAVAVRDSPERLGGQLSADGVDDRELVEVRVGVDAADHGRGSSVHGVVRSLSERFEGARLGRADGQHSDGTAGRAPIKSREPHPLRARWHRPADRQFTRRTAEASVSD